MILDEFTCLQRSSIQVETRELPLHETKSRVDPPFDLFVDGMAQEP